MRVLLIVPPNSQEERYGKFSEIGTLYPPLGLAYVAAVAESEAEVRVLDSEAMNYSYSDIEKITREFNPEVVGMQCYCTTITRCYKVAELIKKFDSKIKVVLGGAQLTLEKEETMKNKNIDFGIYGEGEFVFRNLLRELKQSEKKQNFKNP